MKRMLALALSMILFFENLIFTVAETLNEVKEKKNAVEQQINDLQGTKKKQQESLTSAVNDKNRLTDEQKKVGEQKDKLQQEKQNQQKELRSIEDTLKQAQEDYDDSINLFQARARSMYIGSNKSYLDILLSSGNLVELTSKLFIFSNIAKKDKEIVQKLRTAKKDLDYKKQIQKMQVAEIQMKIQQTSKELTTIESNQNILNSKIRDINDKIKKIEMEEDALLEESRNLSNKIKLFQKTGRKYIGGKMFWPVPSSVEITSPFGLRIHPVLNYSRMHTGIDVAANSGANIVAANDGVVRVSGWEGGYGNTVIIDHGGGIMTLYGHCSALIANEGQRVKSGVTIARVGSTGISTGPHLHFEVRVNGDPVDPLNYLGK